MKKLALILSVVALIAGTSCKNKEKAASTSNDTKNTSSTKTASGSEKKYRLVVSFNSIGTGIDQDAFQKLEKFVKEHPKKPVYEAFTWGREGERDLAFTLKEIKSGEQAKFISDLKAAIGDSDRVKYKENEVPAGKIKKEMAN